MSEAAGSLILRTRVQILRANLNKVKGIRDSIEFVRSDVRTLGTLPEQSGIRKAIAQIRRELLTADAEVKEPKPSRDVVVQALASIDRSADEVQAYLSAAEELVGSIQTRFLPVAQTEVGNTLKDNLADKAEAKIEALDDLIKRIRAAEHGRDDAAARASRQDAWSQYVDRELYGESEKLFREYVDLLGGLALRDGGFDAGICRVADQLIQKCATALPEFAWYSLTIPARREALETTMARIIRLGFPEWTIWTLPLAAHELGHVVAVNRVEPLIQAEGTEGHAPYPTQICFADAFATVAMGPAYACAAILMRLDPFRAVGDEDERLTLKRAQAVQGTLEAMNAAAGRTSPYEGIVVRLREEWRDAVSLANAVCGTKGPEELSQEEAEHVQRVVEFAMSTVGRRGFPASGWETVDDWAKEFAAGNGGAIRPSPVDADVRYVPNAAWVARLEIEDFEQLDRAAIEALDLWARLERLLTEKPEDEWEPMTNTGTQALKTAKAAKPGSESVQSGHRR